MRSHPYGSSEDRTTIPCRAWARGLRVTALWALIFAVAACLPASSDPAWLLVYNGRNAGGPYALGFARSASPVGPWVYLDKDAPAIAAPPPYEHLGKPSLVATSAGYNLYVEALRSTLMGFERDILLFTSLDGRTWTAPDHARVVLRQAGRPTVLYDAADTSMPFKMWYQDPTHQVALAQSGDGVNWTPQGIVLTQGRAGSYDSAGVVPSAVMREGDRYHLFYTAIDEAGYFTGAEASAGNPAGPYQRNPANPVLRREAEATSLLRRDMSAGDRRVDVSNGTRFSPDQPVVLLDQLGEWAYARVLSVQGDIVELDRSVPRSFRREDLATLRSWACAQVYVTHAWKENGRWRLAATSCNQHHLLGSGALELTGLAEGDSLDAIRWNYRLSPILPPARDHVWDRDSRENPSIVRVALKHSK